MAGHLLPGLKRGPSSGVVVRWKEGVKFALRALGSGLRTCLISRPSAHNTLPGCSNQTVRKVTIYC